MRSSTATRRSRRCPVPRSKLLREAGWSVAAILTSLVPPLRSARARAAAHMPEVTLADHDRIALADAVGSHASKRSSTAQDRSGRDAIAFSTARQRPTDGTPRLLVAREPSTGTTDARSTSIASSSSRPEYRRIAELGKTLAGLPQPGARTMVKGRPAPGVSSSSKQTIDWLAAIRRGAAS